MAANTRLAGVSDPVVHATSLANVRMSARKEIMSMRLRELYDRILSEGLDQVTLNPDRLAGRVWAALNNQLSYAVQSRVDTPPKLGERRMSRTRLASVITVFRREQTPAIYAVSLHVGVGVILTARAPNRHRSSRAFSGRDDAGPRSLNTGRENGHEYIAPHRSRGVAARRRRILLQP
jgi:hypothetical protein